MLLMLLAVAFLGINGFFKLSTPFFRFQIESLPSHARSISSLKDQGEKLVLNEVFFTTIGSVLLLHPSNVFGKNAEMDNMENLINLNNTEPKITDICWFDLKIGDNDAKRVEISLFGSFY